MSRPVPRTTHSSCWSSPRAREPESPRAREPESPRAIVMLSLLGSTLTVVTASSANANSVDGPLGTLRVTSPVNVYGNRCGNAHYVWDGWNALELNWTIPTWNVILYLAGLTYRLTRLATRQLICGTAPWVRGYDDDPAFSGIIPACGKHDAVKRLGLFGPNYDGYDSRDRQGVTYVVDYHPVTVTVTKSRRRAVATVLMDGRPWPGVVLRTVTGLKKRVVLRTGVRGKVSIKREATTKGKRVTQRYCQVEAGGALVHRLDARTDPKSGRSRRARCRTGGRPGPSLSCPTQRLLAPTISRIVRRLRPNAAR